MPDQLPALPDHIGSVLNMIARAAADPAVDITKLEALMAMQERVVAKQNAQLFAAAMADAQEEMEPVVKDAANSHIGNRYARLEAIDKAIRPIYTKHGFSVRYRCEDAREGAVKVVCIISHRAGHIEESPIEAPMDGAGSRGQTNKPGVQAIGSTITYLRRYALTMAFNVVMENDSDDDDGEATRRAPKPPPRAAAQQPELSDWERRVQNLDIDLSANNKDPAKWTAILQKGVELAEIGDEVAAIQGIKGVQDALNKAPAKVKADLQAMFAVAFRRVEAPPADAGLPEGVGA